MVRCSKTRRVLKWGGTLTCGLLLALWVLSIPTPGMVTGDLWFFVSRSGAVVLQVSQLEGPTKEVAQAEADFRQLLAWGQTWNPQPCAWRSLGSYGLVLPGGYRMRRPIDPRNSVREVTTSIWAPYWLLLVLDAAPTLLLWHLDRRRIPPGHCQRCDYNLTGNVSGRCPECGTPTTAV
jgi:hypothetical protein